MIIVGMTREHGLWDETASFEENFPPPIGAAGSFLMRVVFTIMRAR